MKLVYALAIASLLLLPTSVNADWADTVFTDLNNTAPHRLMIQSDDVGPYSTIGQSGGLREEAVVDAALTSE
jgi:hypothetical protein